MNNNPIAIAIEREQVEAGMSKLTDSRLILTKSVCDSVLIRLTPDDPRYAKYKLHSSIITTELIRRMKVHH